MFGGGGARSSAEDACYLGGLKGPWEIYSLENSSSNDLGPNFLLQL